MAAFNAWLKATMLPSEKSDGCSTLWIIAKAGLVIMSRDQLNSHTFQQILSELPVTRVRNFSAY
jgi:hypothetical protein